jgi:uncharacterized membrane protein YjfL (UPF0719 family)
MNPELFYYGLLHLGLSVLISVFVLYLTFSRVTRYFKRKFDFSYDNVAFTIFISGLIFSVGYIFEGVHQPMMTVINFLRHDPQLKGSIFFEASKYVALFLVVGLFFTGIVTFVSIYFFTVLTHMIDEFDELKRGNVAVGIVLATVIVTVSLLCRDSLVTILESFIPYPDRTNFMGA